MTIETRDFSPVKEKKSASFETVLLPGFSRHADSFSRDAWDDVSVDHVERNAQILEQLTHRGKSTVTSVLASRMYEAFLAYKKVLPDILSAPPIEETLADHLPNLHFLQERKPFRRVEDYTRYLYDYFRTVTSPQVLCNDSHLTLLPEISAAVSLAPEKKGKIGLIIFDRHVDWYTFPDDDRDWKKRAPSKGNMLIPLLEEGMVGAIAIIGIKGYEKEKLVTGCRHGIPLAAEDRPRHEFYRRWQDRIILLSADSYTTLTGSFRPRGKEHLASDSAQLLDRFADLGITSIFPSFDVDVLRLQTMLYTSPEYNSLGAMLTQGVQELSYTPVSEITFDDLEYINHLAFHADQNLACQLPTMDFYHGLPLSAMGIALKTIGQKAQAREMELGISLPSGGRILGDVTELFLPDYRGNTAKAVAAYTTMLQQLTI